MAALVGRRRTGVRPHRPISGLPDKSAERQVLRVCVTLSSEQLCLISHSQAGVLGLLRDLAEEPGEHGSHFPSHFKDRCDIAVFPRRAVSCRPLIPLASINGVKSIRVWRNIKWSCSGLLSGLLSPQRWRRAAEEHRLNRRTAPCISGPPPPPPPPTRGSTLTV